MQLEKPEMNIAIARAMGESYAPAPADYVGDEVHGARFIAWATPQLNQFSLSEDLQWIFEWLKSQQGEVVALFWAIKLWC